MNRRDFIKCTAATGLASALPATTVTAKPQASKTSQPKGFFFRPDGTFKILQFTDTHYIAGDPRSERALKNICEMLDAEKPDLVVHTGDVIWGKPAEKCLREILAPISERQIPFAVTLGNHDGEFDLNRKEIFDLIKSIPYNINQGVEGIYGDSNDVVTLSSSRSADKPQWVFYLLDSGCSSIKEHGIDGYDYIRSSQIDWYRRQSAAFRQQNGGKPVPSLAFFHIPIPEFTYGLRYEKLRSLKGNFGEEPCPPNVNSGLFVAMKEQEDVRAIICGHDHDNDYAMLWRGMFFIYGRFSGCDTVYNHLKPNGARVVQLTDGQPGFRSWVRCYGGEVTQNLRYPDDFSTR